MFAGKEVLVNAETGFEVFTDAGYVLSEDQLSSGEYHLMFLLVASLTARHRGTVIAIDEPELSMHISWQRQLVRALLECAANSQPQLLLATHSPDIAAEFQDAMIELPTRQVASQNT